MWPSQQPIIILSATKQKKEYEHIETANKDVVKRKELKTLRSEFSVSQTLSLKHSTSRTAAVYSYVSIKKQKEHK